MTVRNEVEYGYTLQQVEGDSTFCCPNNGSCDNQNFVRIIRNAVRNEILMAPLYILNLNSLKEILVVTSIGPSGMVSSRGLAVHINKHNT